MFNCCKRCLKSFFILTVGSLFLFVGCGEFSDEGADGPSSAKNGKGDYESFKKYQSDSSSPAKIEIQDEGFVQGITLQVSMNSSKNLKMNNLLKSTRLQLMVNQQELFNDIVSIRCQSESCNTFTTDMLEVPLPKDRLRSQGIWKVNIITEGASPFIPDDVKVTQMSLDLLIDPTDIGNPFGLALDTNLLREEFKAAFDNSAGQLTKSEELVLAGQEWSCVWHNASKGSTANNQQVVRFYPVKGKTEILQSKFFELDSAANINLNNQEDKLVKTVSDPYNFTLTGGSLIGNLPSNVIRIYRKGINSSGQEADSDTLVFEEHILSTNNISTDAIAQSNASAVAYGKCSLVNAKNMYVSRTKRGTVSRNDVTNDWAIDAARPAAKAECENYRNTLTAPQFKNVQSCTIEGCSGKQISVFDYSGTCKWAINVLELER